VLDALDVAFDIRVGLDVQPDLRAVEEVFAIVLHRVVVAVDPHGNGLWDANADERVVGVRVFDVEDLIRFEAKNFAVDREFVVADFVRKAALVELHALAAGIERVDGARLCHRIAHAIEISEEIASQLQVRHDGVLEFDAGHRLVDAFEQRQERVVSRRIWSAQ